MNKDTHTNGDMILNKQSKAIQSETITMPKTYKEALKEKILDILTEVTEGEGVKYSELKEGICKAFIEQEVDQIISLFDQHLERLEGELGKLSNRQSNRDQYGMGYLTALSDALALIKEK